MPQVKSANSLYDTCLVFISRNMDKFGTEFNVNVGPADGVDCNPFDRLPSGLLEALMKLIIRKKFEDEHTGKFLHHLLTPHLLSLRFPDYTFQEEINLHYILQLATIRCKHLKTLSLGCYIENYTDCLKFIPQFSHLQVLRVHQFETKDIPHSISGDDFFHLLGIHCTNLRELHARFNLVSDAGIQGLCVAGNCKSIRILDLICNPITTKGIQMILDNLPSLKVLLHHNLVEDLAIIAQSALDQRLASLPKYSLSALHLYNSVYKSGSLEKSILLCPYVTDLHIKANRKGLNNSELLSLLSLKELFILEISHNIALSNETYDPFRYDEDLTFHGGILPLLKRFGNSLKKLKVEGYFNDIDTSAVIEFCPKLHTLILCKNFKLKWAKEVDWELLNTERITSAPVSVLKNLEELILHGSYSSRPFVSSENLLKLLSSPLLKSVELHHCDNIPIDEIMERANNQNPFRYLENLEFRYCNTVTKKGIDVFMHENNPLKLITVFDCDKITSEDKIKWKENAIWKKRNWRMIFCFL